MNFFKFDTSPLQKKFKNAIREKKLAIKYSML